MPKFVTVRHPDVEKTARVATSALAHLSGWEVVEDPAPKRRQRSTPDTPAGSPASTAEPDAPRRRTRTRRTAAAPTPSTPEQDGES